MKKTSLIIPIMLLLAACGGKKNEKAITVDSTSVTKTDTIVSDSSASKAVPGPVPNTINTDEYVRNMAAMTYMWAWPMVNIHNRVEVFRKLSAPTYLGGIVPVAPPNSVCMLTDYV